MIRWIQAIAVMVLQGLPASMARQGFRSGRLTLSAALLLLVGDGLCQDPSPAQSPSIQPDPIVVTVSAEAIPLSASSASVTILTREFVEESRAESMADLLRQVPFHLYVSNRGAGWVDDSIPAGRRDQLHPGNDRRGSGERYHQSPRGSG